MDLLSDSTGFYYMVDLNGRALQAEGPRWSWKRLLSEALESGFQPDSGGSAIDLGAAANAPSWCAVSTFLGPLEAL